MLYAMPAKENPCLNTLVLTICVGLLSQHLIEGSGLVESRPGSGLVESRPGSGLVESRPP